MAKPPVLEAAPEGALRGWMIAQALSRADLRVAYVTQRPNVYDVAEETNRLAIALYNMNGLDSSRFRPPFGRVKLKNDSVIWVAPAHRLKEFDGHRLHIALIPRSAENAVDIWSILAPAIAAAEDGHMYAYDRVVEEANG